MGCAVNNKHNCLIDIIKKEQNCEWEHQKESSNFFYKIFSNARIVYILTLICNFDCVFLCLTLCDFLIFFSRCFRNIPQLR